jgi:hypothetical protein
VSADTLVRYQLDTLGGHNTELRTARGAIRYFLNTDCGPTIDREDADTASGTVTCGGSPTISFTVKRAFRGLASSIWYLSESRK